MEESAPAAFDWHLGKSEEARQRMAATATGETGAWPWPKLPVQHAASPDAEWLLELDLARD